jgi:hypothetical protein
LVLGVAFFGVDVPGSFGADTPVSVDCASDGVGNAETATNPPRIKAALMARVLIFASM